MFNGYHTLICTLAVFYCFVHEHVANGARVISFRTQNIPTKRHAKRLDVGFWCRRHLSVLPDWVRSAGALFIHLALGQVLKINMSVLQNLKAINSFQRQSNGEMRRRFRSTSVGSFKWDPFWWGECYMRSKTYHTSSKLVCLPRSVVSFHTSFSGANN